MAWMTLTARGHGRPRLDDQPRTTPSPRLAAAVARIGAHEWPVRLTPAMEVLLATVGELAGTEATPENAEALVEEFGSAARMLGAVIRNTANPTMLGAGYKVNVIPTEATAHVDGRFLPGLRGRVLRHARRALRRGHRRSTSSPSQPRLGDAVRRPPGRRDEPLPARRGPRRPRRAVPHERRHRRQALRPSSACAPTASRPLRLPADLDFTALFHGVDERVPTDALEFGARVFDRFLDEV